ncbi:MAG: ribonuclease J [Rickettsiales bacterium]|jgi:ribonuclease J|nr:ribonuclease J [Rickettsiales bacterium]
MIDKKMDVGNLNFRKNKDDLLFIPLGGSNEVGLNCNLYHCDGKWIVVDCGIGFVKTVPGVELLVPDISLLRKLKKDILGVFITHIHEDHLGAVQYVWRDLELPIYASRFTKLFLQEKLKEYDFHKRVKINELNEGGKVNLDPFQIEFVGLTHSTPEMNALIIKTEKGTILHSGDWKFDDDPVIGQKSNVKRLKQLGSRGEILAAVCESTNVFNDEKPQLESELFDSFYKIIKNKTGLVVFTTFASNIGRIKTIVDVAKKTRRKVALVGNSLYRLIRVAKEVGYLQDKSDFIGEDEIKNYKKENLILIATGCQGNVNAGVNKLANGTYRHLKINEGDLVIFSSKVIPGNEKEIQLLYNKFAEKDVEVITEQDEFVHVSGHYCVQDLKDFYSYVKPKIAIAVHGDAVHLQEHHKIARSCGIKSVGKSKNGVILKISSDKVEKIGQIRIDSVVVDGKRLLPTSSEILGVREKMEEVGVVFVNLIISTKYKIIADPVIATPGGYNLKKDKATKEILTEDIVKGYNNGIRQINELKQNNKSKFLTDEEKENFLKQKVKNAVNKLYDTDIGKEPVIEIFFSKIQVTPNVS